MEAPNGRWDACAWPPKDVGPAVAHYVLGDSELDIGEALWDHYSEEEP